MTDDRNKPFPLLYLFIIAVIFIVLVEVAFGQANCTGHSCNDEGTPGDVNLTGGAVSNVIGGNSSRGYAVSGAQVDVDIGQCMGSVYEAWLLGIIHAEQKLIENAHCVAMNEHNIGNHSAEARIKCKQTKTGGNYDTFTDCFDEQKEHWNKEPTGEGASGPADRVAEIVEENEERAQKQFEDYQMQITDLTSSVQQLEKQPAQIIYKIPPELQEQIDAAADRRARAKAVWQGEN